MKQSFKCQVLTSNVLILIAQCLVFKYLLPVKEIKLQFSVVLLYINKNIQC